MPTYYEFNGAAKICEYANTPGAAECTEGVESTYFKIEALKCTTPASKAKKGFKRGGGCCNECLVCDCWCHFATTGGTPDDVEFIIDGVDVCTCLSDRASLRRPGGGAAVSWATFISEMEGTIDVSWWKRDAGITACRWREAGNAYEISDTDFDGGNWTAVTLYYNLDVYYADFAAALAGDFGYTVRLEIGAGTHQWVFCGGDGRPACSDETTGEVDNVVACDPCSGFQVRSVGENGSMIVNWENDAVADTPWFYDIDFTTADAAGKILEVCSGCGKSDIVGQAIIQLLDPDLYAPMTDDSPDTRAYRFLQNLDDACIWTLPHLRVRGHFGWWITGRLRQTQAGANTTWDLDLYVENLNHRTDRTAAGFEHETCFCLHQRDRHNFWGGTGVVQAQYNCDTPPANLDNQFDCTDPHADTGPAAGYLDYTPCGQFGRAIMTAGP